MLFCIRSNRTKTQIKNKIGWLKREKDCKGDWKNLDKDSGEQKYFKKALSDFTFEMASGGAIRHLADRGYTVGEIVKMLDFPTPYERVGDLERKHFLETGVLLLDEPTKEAGPEKYEYVADYDEYGRKSFRKVILEERREASSCWSENSFDQKKFGGLSQFLKEKCQINGEAFCYVSCRFGLDLKRDPNGFEDLLSLLEPLERDYIMGIFSERRILYHQLNHRMGKIVVRLYESIGYEGYCYFIKTREKIKL